MEYPQKSLLRGDTARRPYWDTEGLLLRHRLVGVHAWRQAVLVGVTSFSSTLYTLKRET